MKRIWKYMAGVVDARDVMLVLGLAMLGAGCWMVWPPAGLIAPGLVLSYVAVFGVRP